MGEELSKGDILESIDRELGFFRRRAGQVFFFGLLAEAMIIVGEKKFEFPKNEALLKFIVISFFYIAVVTAGIILGSEYRRRIHILKRHRLEFSDTEGFRGTYPRFEEQVFSEINVLYYTLSFISFSGIILEFNKYHSLPVYLSPWLYLLFVLLATFIYPTILSKIINLIKPIMRRAP